MNVYITLDLEGVTSVTDLEQVRHGTPEFAVTRELITQEINASIEGAMAAGADAFLVNEGHGKHRNVIPQKLNRAARLLSGRNKLYHYMHKVGDGYDAMFMVGFHAGAGKRRGILGHTFHAYECRINGRVFSEVGLGIGLAGYFGVPCVLVTGDSETCRDARDFVPNMETVAVKEAITENSAIHMHPEVAQEQIRAAAQRAIERADEIKPFTMEPPLVIEIQLYTALMGDMHALIPNCERVDDRLIRYEAADFEEVFKFFLLSSTLSMTTMGLGVML